MGITDLVVLGKTVGNITEVVTSDKSTEEKLKALRAAYSSGSMGAFMKRYIVQPTIFISKSAYRQEDIHDLINRQLDIFAGFFVDVFKTIITNYGMDPEIGVSVMGTGGGEVMAADMALIKIGDMALQGKKYLNQLALGLADFESAVRSFESEEFFGTIPSFEATEENYLKQDLKIAMEASNKDDDEVKKEYVRAMGKDVSILDNQVTYDFYIRKVEMRFSTNPMKTYASGGKRALTLNKKGEVVGDKEKGVEVPDKIEFTIPITIKATLISMDPIEFTNALEPKKRETGFFRRLEELRSSRISYKEFFLGSDLIQARKQQRLKDVSQLISQLEKNIVSANLKTLGTGMVGFEKYYNMFIITQEDEKRIRDVTGWDIVNNNGKEKFLTSLNAFSCLLVDTDYDKVGLMIKDVDGVSIVDRAKLKKKSKKDDITDLVHAIMVGQAPRF